MAIPGYEDLMLPLLELLADKKEHSLRGTIDALSKKYNFTEEEKKELLPSGLQRVIDNRVGWARTYLKKAGLVESTRRGYIRITNRGIKALSENLATIDNKYLEQFPEFIEFKKGNKAKSKDSKNKTPEELLEEGYQSIRQNLASDLLSEVKKSSPAFFEKLVVELLVKMGYGGSMKDAGEAIGRSGDEGIDGVIKEDRLELDLICLGKQRRTR